MNAYRTRWAGLATLLIAILALATIMAFSPQAAFAQSGNATEAFVQQNVDRGYQILNNRSLSSEQRRAQFRNFLLSLTDLHRIGMFTLGQYANGASPADLQAFDRAFTDYAVAVYETRLGKYTGQTLKVTGSVVRAPDDVVVNAVVVNLAAGSNQEPIRAAFRVRKTADGRPIITDMIQIDRRGRLVCEATSPWTTVCDRLFIAFIAEPQELAVGRTGALRER
jgi:phospholipid transport system substrate-binding protein